MRKSLDWTITAVILLIIGGAAFVFAQETGLSAPKPYIVGQRGQDAMVGSLDYGLIVDCTVGNDGRSGEVLALAVLQTPYGRRYERRAPVYVERGQKITVQFQFEEPTIFDDLSRWRYSCEAQ